MDFQGQWVDEKWDILRKTMVSNFLSSDAKPHFATRLKDTKCYDKNNMSGYLFGNYLV